MCVVGKPSSRHVNSRGMVSELRRHEPGSKRGGIAALVARERFPEISNVPFSCQNFWDATAKGYMEALPTQADILKKILADSKAGGVSFYPNNLPLWKQALTNPRSKPLPGER